MNIIQMPKRFKPDEDLDAAALREALNFTNDLSAGRRLTIIHNAAKELLRRMEEEK